MNIASKTMKTLLMCGLISIVAIVALSLAATAETEIGNDSIDSVVPVATSAAPVADAGPDQTVENNTVVTFNASASTDDGTIANYTWTFVDGTFAKTMWGVTPTWTFANYSAYTVTLTVTDDEPLTDTDDVVITVADITPPDADIVATPGGPYHIGDTIVFSANGSTDNVAIVNYTWFIGNTAEGWDNYFIVECIGIGSFSIAVNETDAAGNWCNLTHNYAVVDNVDPVANAGADQTVNENLLVTFDGSASSDNIGVVNYTWAFTYNSTATTLWGVGPTFTFWVPGNYTVTLTVKDAVDLTATDTMWVLVKDATNPIANANTDQAVNEDTLVTFVSTGSSDNVDITTYTWTFTDVTLQTLTGATQTYTFATPGVYTVTLTVADAAGNFATDTMVVTVADRTKPVANAGPDAFVNESVAFTFAGSATDNVAVATYTWTFADGQNATGVPYNKTLTGATPSYTFANVSVYVVTLNVTDAAGNYNTDTVNITVNDTTAPVANAGPAASVNQNAVFTFAGSATDNVAPATFVWTFNDGAFVKTLNGATPTYTFANVTSYTVTLTVADAAGNTGTDTVVITVLDAIPPVANAGLDASTPQNAVFAFNGSLSIDNIGVVSYLWTFLESTTTYVNATNVTITNNHTVTLTGINATYTFTNLTTYVVTLTVTDARGLIDTDDITINVTDAIAPTADAGDDQNVIIGETVTFDASMSDDNVAVTNWTWTFNDGLLNVTLYGETVTYTNFVNLTTCDVTLTVEDAVGLTDTETFTIDFAEPLNISAGLDQTVELADGKVTVTFNGTATGGFSPLTYAWTFTIGNKTFTMTGAAPTFEFNATDTYTVTLTVTDAEGNTLTDTVDIIVEEESVTPPPDDEEEEEEEEEENNSFLWIIIVIVILVIIVVVVVVVVLMMGKKPEGGEGGAEGEAPAETPPEGEQPATPEEPKQ